MTLGRRTVTFVSVSNPGRPGYLGVTEKVYSATSVSGCHFRPMSSTEDGSTNVETGMWKCTAPPVAAALAIRAPDELVVDGATYLVEGAAMPKYDTDGSIDHVTIICKHQEG